MSLISIMRTHGADRGRLGPAPGPKAELKACCCGRSGGNPALSRIALARAENSCASATRPVCSQTLARMPNDFAALVDQARFSFPDCRDAAGPLL